MNDTRNQNLLNVINQFLNQLGGFTLTKDEFYDVKATIHMGKIQAIKHLRSITAQNEETLFNLDLTPRYDSTPHSTITHWAVMNDVDLRTGEVIERTLGLKEAKDIIEFIILNQ